MLQAIKDPTSGFYRVVGKVEGVVLGFHVHNFLTFSLTINYGGAGQIIGGYVLSTEDQGLGKQRAVARPNAGDWLIRLMRAFGVHAWEDIKGRSAYFLWATENPTHTMPLGIENLPTERGERFLFADMNSI